MHLLGKQMNLLTKTFISVSVIILLLFSQKTDNSLSGQISYPQQITLTEETIVTIQLVDISKQDDKNFKQNL